MTGSGTIRPENPSLHRRQNQSPEILPGERLDFAALGQITFEEPDMETFQGLPMAIKAARIGGSMPTVFNAANERAVAKFLRKEIAFLDIYRIIEEAMERHQVIDHPREERTRRFLAHYST